MHRFFIHSLLFLSPVLAAQDKPALYTELYRPQFHFTSAANWFNDPNGLVYNKGAYHLFYQHNPFENEWGHMTWGHAVTNDLFHWRHLPIAIPEENGIMIFSGSCVVDKNNTSGFATKPGQAPMVAIYTGHVENVSQSECLAYSLDNGITWTKYKNNPVLDLHKKDFRDPKVFWYTPKKYWVMAVMLPLDHILQFYSSKNLRQWNHLSDFGPAGDINGVWECPDLSQVPVHGMPNQKKWLLLTSQNPTMQYFVGEFDGTNFKNENPMGKIFRPDYGPDYYAAITYNQLPASQLPTSIGWVNNWNYANDIPTRPWKGAMSLPRTLSIKKINNEWILFQQPVAKAVSLRQPMVQLKNKTVEDLLTLNEKSQQCELDILLEPSEGVICGVRLAENGDHGFEIGYNTRTQMLYIDRSQVPHEVFSKEFERLSHFETKLPLQNKLLRLHIFYDNSIIEIFANKGEAVMTAQVFSSRNDNGVQLFSRKGKTKLLNLEMLKIKSTW